MRFTKKQFMLYPLAVGVLLGATSFLGTGCGKKDKAQQPQQQQAPTEEQMAEEEKLYQEIEETFMKIMQAQDEGKPEEAMKLLDAALANPKFASQKSRFFSQKVSMLLSTNDVEGASAMVLDAWKNNQDCARSVFGMIYNYYQQKNDTKLVLGWCEKLSNPALKLPDDLLTQVMGWQLSATIQSGDEKSATEAITSLASHVSEPSGVQLLSSALGQLIDQKKIDFLNALIAGQASNAKMQTAGYQQLFTTLKMRSILVLQQWDKIAPVYTTCMTALPDADLFKLAREIFSTLKKNGQEKLMESLAEQTFKGAGSKENTVNFGAKTWIDCCVPANIKELPGRMETLIDAKVSPIELGAIYERYFYELYNDHPMLEKMCEAGEHLIKVCDDTNTVNSVVIKLLDGAFITDNYKRAIEMLKKGIPGKDETWHSMTLPKVEAHYALQQAEKEVDPAKRNAFKESAIANFRTFMNVWSKVPQEDEYDPTTGIAYCKEWILGRNADRISKLYSDINKPDQAKAAREEAKAFFVEALKKTASDPDAMKILKKDIAPYGL